jgi:hypothetical protein
VITAIHTLVYADDAPAARALFADVIDIVHSGWATLFYAYQA